MVIGFGTLGLLLLLDGGNNAPRGTAGANNVLVGDREKVTLIDSKLSADLRLGQCLPPNATWGACHTLATSCKRRLAWTITKIRIDATNLHVGDHF